MVAVFACTDDDYFARAFLVAELESSFHTNVVFVEGDCRSC
jgi:hypothetical protein